MNESEEDYFENQLSSFTFQKSTTKRKSNQKPEEQTENVVSLIKKSNETRDNVKKNHINTSNQIVEEVSYEFSNENLFKNSNAFLNENSNQLSNRVPNINSKKKSNENSNESPNENSSEVICESSNFITNANKSFIEISNENQNKPLTLQNSAEFSNENTCSQDLPAQIEIKSKKKKETSNKNKAKKEKKTKDQKDSNDETKKRIVQEQTEYIYSILKDSKTGKINLQSLQKFINSNEENGYDEETILKMINILRNEEESSDFLDLPDLQEIFKQCRMKLSFHTK